MECNYFSWLSVVTFSKSLLSMLTRWSCCCLFSVCGRRVLVPCFCYALLCVLSSFAIISMGIRELFALHLLFSKRHVAVNILCILPMVHVGLRRVIRTFSGYTHSLFMNVLLLIWDISIDLNKCIGRAIFYTSGDQEHLDLCIPSNELINVVPRAIRDMTFESSCLLLGKVGAV